MLKFFLIITSFLLVYLLDDSLEGSQKKLEIEKIRLSNIQIMLKLMENKQNMPFFLSDPAIVTAHCFDFIQIKIKACNLKVTQKEVKATSFRKNYFFRSQILSYELLANDLGSIHKFFYELEKSPQLYQIEKATIAQDTSVKDITKYQIQLDLTVYFLNPSKNSSSKKS